jgi:hypothetical protein
MKFLNVLSRGICSIRLTENGSHLANPLFITRPISGGETQRIAF